LILYDFFFHFRFWYCNRPIWFNLLVRCNGSMICISLFCFVLFVCFCYQVKQRVAAAAAVTTVSVCVFSCRILWQKNWQTAKSLASFISLFLFVFFCNKKKKANLFKQEYVCWLNKRCCFSFNGCSASLLCNYDPNFGKILYQKESSNYVVVYAYF